MNFEEIEEIKKKMKEQETEALIRMRRGSMEEVGSFFSWNIYIYIRNILQLQQTITIISLILWVHSSISFKKLNQCQRSLGTSWEVNCRQQISGRLNQTSKLSHCNLRRLALVKNKRSREKMAEGLLPLLSLFFPAGFSLSKQGKKAFGHLSPALILLPIY